MSRRWYDLMHRAETMVVTRGLLHHKPYRVYLPIWVEREAHREGYPIYPDFGGELMGLRVGFDSRLPDDGIRLQVPA